MHTVLHLLHSLIYLALCAQLVASPAAQEAFFFCLLWCVTSHSLAVCVGTGKVKHLWFTSTHTDQLTLGRDGDKLVIGSITRADGAVSSSLLNARLFLHVYIIMVYGFNLVLRIITHTHVDCRDLESAVLPMINRHRIKCVWKDNQGGMIKSTFKQTAVYLIAHSKLTSWIFRKQHFDI